MALRYAYLWYTEYRNVYFICLGGVVVGRPKIYASEAEKMRAYRSRRAAKTVSVDRRSHDWLLKDYSDLRDSVAEAAGLGDPLARSLGTMMPEDTIADLIKHFRASSEALRASQVASVPSPVPPGVGATPVSANRNIYATIPDGVLPVPAPVAGGPGKTVPKLQSKRLRKR